MTYQAWETPPGEEGVLLDGENLIWWWTAPVPGQIVQPIAEYVHQGPPDAAKDSLRHDFHTLGKLLGFLGGIDVV